LTPKPGRNDLGDVHRCRRSDHGIAIQHDHAGVPIITQHSVWAASEGLHLPERPSRTATRLPEPAGASLAEARTDPIPLQEAPRSHEPPRRPRSPIEMARHSKVHTHKQSAQLINAFASRAKYAGLHLACGRHAVRVLNSFSADVLVSTVLLTILLVHCSLKLAPSCCALADQSRVAQAARRSDSPSTCGGAGNTSLTHKGTNGLGRRHSGSHETANFKPLFVSATQHDLHERRQH
jgi:hypothetical protein